MCEQVLEHDVQRRGRGRTHGQLVCRVQGGDEQQSEEAALQPRLPHTLSALLVPAPADLPHLQACISHFLPHFPPPPVIHTNLSKTLLEIELDFVGKKIEVSKKIASFSGFLLKIFYQGLVNIFPNFYKMQGSFPRCRDVLQNFLCRVPDFSMFYQKLACILFMCLQNFRAFSTREHIL